MKLVGVAWRGFAVPFRRPYVAAGTRATTRYGLLLFVRASNGLTGTGEASPLGVGSRREVEALATRLQETAPGLLGTESGLADAWRNLPTEYLPPSLRFGIETALLDLAGKALEMPVARLLGGLPDTLLPVNALISADGAQGAVQQAREAVATGFTSLKLKVGAGTLAQDEELVSAVRAAVGPEVRLRLDPNQAWSVPQAIEAIRHLSPYGLEFVEQPVVAQDMQGMAEVRQAVPVPIAADEALGSLDDARRLLEMEAADLLVVKAARLGGVGTVLAVTRLARNAGKPVVVTSSLEAGVGLLASAHVAATLGTHPVAHGLATGLLLKDDLLSPPLVPRQGTFAVPQRPGLGGTLSEQALNKYDIAVRGRVGPWEPHGPWGQG